MVIDGNLEEAMKVTVIATGFDRADGERSEPTRRPEPTRESRPLTFAAPRREAAAARERPILGQDPLQRMRPGRYREAVVDAYI